MCDKLTIFAHLFNLTLAFFLNLTKIYYKTKELLLINLFICFDRQQVLKKNNVCKKIISISLSITKIENIILLKQFSFHMSYQYLNFKYLKI